MLKPLLFSILIVNFLYSNQANDDLYINGLISKEEYKLRQKREEELVSIKAELANEKKEQELSESEDDVEEESTLDSILSILK